MSSQPIARPQQPVQQRPDDDAKKTLTSSDISYMAEAEAHAREIYKEHPPKEYSVSSSLAKKLQSRLEQFDDICVVSRKLFSKKNEQYADSIARTGVIGAAVSIVGISARIEHMVIGAPDAGKSNADEIVELIKDLHNYANIMGIMIMDDNWKPE